MNLTREQAIDRVGIEAVAAVGKENCEPTCRVGFNGKCQGDALTEWAASVAATDADGSECTLTAYYYTNAEQDAEIERHDGDAGVVDWAIDHYEIV